ncbi:Golgi phosphoprotein 3 GPP34 [Humitalea rosea]|uniref:Golgi phosphoprotein 3 GPP34 n=1 Tax=Humitalea rosea TaxID=990373 RepID=A0A2W7JFV8_9PROT|nr:GPP34 family phosphoprotein [Humitalea rosea]PZW50943.1 Golgi phosphoprotein 3 GPP34 [Humitalea rosea]
MALTIPEELLLLMLDDTTGRLHVRAAPAGDYALAGAILAELAMRNRLDSDTTRLFVADPAPTGDALLDGVLSEIAGSPREEASRWWIETLARNAESYRASLFDRLVARGILRVEDGKFLWFFSERRYPVVSDKAEREVKARLLGVIFDDEIPEPHDALLIGLCRAAGLFGLILSPEELDRAQPRIDQVADLEELNRALSSAVRDIFIEIARWSPMM